MLTRPIRNAAERAGHRGLDPPVSSWPPLAKSAFAAVLDAQVFLALEADGSDHVPLSHVWRLYENWLAIATRDALSPLLGAGEEFAGEGSGWGWEWAVGSVLVRLQAQATVGRDPSVELSGHPDGLVSVLSDLRPDVLLTVSDPEGSQGVFCIDAKRRTAATKMDASEVASAASKYIWGIRSPSQPDEPLASALIVSSAPLGEMHDQERSYVSTQWLLPSVGVGDFRESVGAKVSGLIERVRASRV